MASADAVMRPFRTLDLLLLTLNCGKAPIDVPIFAGHLQHALSDHATASARASLPDLVVFSLQETAPLGHAFVGSYFLNQYLTRFDEVLNLAAAQVDGYQFDTATAGSDADAEEEEEEPVAGSSATGPFKGHTKHYHLVRQAHVGMVAILLFARDPSVIQNVQVAHCGFGVADMGNKGAVGLRILYGLSADGEGGGQQQHPPSELTFVAAHLAAMEWNKKRRNANWRSIVAGLTFGNPKAVMAAAEAAAAPAAAAPLQSSAVATAAALLGRGPQGRRHDEAASDPITPEEEAEADAADAAGDNAWLLLGQQQQRNPHRQSDDVEPDVVDGSVDRDLRRQLHDLSVFKPNSLLFVAGDLNYRIGDARPPPGAALPTAHTWPAFLARDQLTQERLAGRTLHGLQEAPIAFPPTYKYDVVDAEALREGVEPENAEEIQAWQQKQQLRQRQRQQQPEGGGQGLAGTGDGAGAESASSCDDDNETEPVPWKYANHRWPSWCDRILYLDVPERTKMLWRAPSRSSNSSSDRDSSVPEVDVIAYQPLPLMRTTDHQAVYLRARVPLLGTFDGGTEARPEDGGELEEEDGDTTGAGRDGTWEEEEGGEGDDEQQRRERRHQQAAVAVDPREHLPVPIDAHAWERRARARVRERVVGSGMLLFNTREGAAVMVTATLVLVGAYWLYVSVM